MAEQQDRSPYAAQAEYWSSPASRPWAEQHERQDRALAGLAEATLGFAAPQPGERVLDIGCGSGTTLLQLAARVGPGGYVLGADISAPSTARARERIAAAGLRHADTICADVATHPFAASGFDLVFARLGVMFFDDPRAAFLNVHRAMKPGGRWRWPCSARQAKTRGLRRRFHRCVTCCRQCRHPVRMNPACSRGAIRPG